MLDNEVALTIISSGVIIIGGVLSMIVTCCTSVMKLPDASVAVHVTVVAPSGKNSGASFVIVDIPIVSVANALSNPTIFS